MRPAASSWLARDTTKDEPVFIDVGRAYGAMWLPTVILTGEPVSVRKLGASAPGVAVHEPVKVFAPLGYTLTNVTWSPRSFMEQRAESALAAALSALRGVTGLYTTWSRGSLAIWVTVDSLDADTIHGIAKGLQTVWEAIGYVNHRLWVVDNPHEVPSGCRDLLESW